MLKEFLSKLRDDELDKLAATIIEETNAGNFDRLLEKMEWPEICLIRTVNENILKAAHQVGNSTLHIKMLERI